MYCENSIIIGIYKTRDIIENKTAKKEYVFVLQKPLLPNCRIDNRVIFFLTENTYPVENIKIDNA